MASDDAQASQPVLAEREADFKRGRGRMLLGLFGAALLALYGAWQLLAGGDDARVYGELGRKINGLRKEYFDPFWACALSGTDPRELKSNADLIQQLQARAREHGGAYAVHLRDRCAPKLASIEPALDALIVPDGMKGDVERLREANAELRSGVSSFVSALDDPGHGYDEARVNKPLEQIAHGWFEFEKAHAELNRWLKAKLDKAHGA